MDSNCPSQRSLRKGGSKPVGNRARDVEWRARPCGEEGQKKRQKEAGLQQWLSISEDPKAPPLDEVCFTSD